MVEAELRDQRGWQGQRELGLAPARLDALAAGELPVPASPLRAFAGVGDAARRARPLDLRAGVAALDATGQAVAAVLVPGQRFGQGTRCRLAVHCTGSSQPWW